MVYLQKGKKKLNVNSIFGENCMILKKFSLGKQPYTGPCYTGLEFSKIFYLQIFASDQMFNWQYEAVNWHFHDHVSYYYNTQ
jgi:hypothetical protein